MYRDRLAGLQPKTIIFPLELELGKKHKAAYLHRSTGRTQRSKTDNVAKIYRYTIEGLGGHWFTLYELRGDWPERKSRKAA